MTEKLYYEAISRFEGACHIDILPAGHRSRSMHGHSYVVRVRAFPCQKISAYPGSELAGLSARLDRCTETVNYTLLNDLIEIPTDENLARWFGEKLELDGLQSVGIQSTKDEGADLENNGEIHIWRRFRFEAAHQLPFVPEGHKCGRMHGHGFEVVIHVQQSLQSDSPMGLDFDLIEKKWQTVKGQLHYRCLNDIPGLENPTSELIAKWIWDRLINELPDLSWVSVYETKSSGCHYNGEQYRIWKEQSFESALVVRTAPQHSSARNLHGHSYLVRLHICRDLDEVMGWIVDYGEVKEMFNATYRRIDHQRLDEIEGLSEMNLATFINWLKRELSATIAGLDRIDLYETPGCGAVLCWGNEPPALPTKTL